MDDNENQGLGGVESEIPPTLKKKKKKEDGHALDSRSSVIGPYEKPLL